MDRLCDDPHRWLDQLIFALFSFANRPVAIRIRCVNSRCDPRHTLVSFVIRTTDIAARAGSHARLFRVVP